MAELSKDFIEISRLAKNDKAAAEHATLFKAYAEWCEESNEEAETQTKFGRRMNDLGFATDRGLGGPN